jgi:hypothetical protein
VHDAGAGRDDLEVVEGGLPPAQELVPLAVALVLELDVLLEGVRRAEEVGDDGVIDDELGRSERIDLLRVSAEGADRLAHGGEVDDARNAGEILHDHAGRGELDLGVGLGRGLPRSDGLDVVLRDVGAVLRAQQVLEQHLEAERELLVARDGVDAEHLVVGSRHRERALGIEAVDRRHCRLPLPTPHDRGRRTHVPARQP